MVARRAALVILLGVAACGTDAARAPSGQRETIALLPLTEMGANTDSVSIVLEAERYRIGDPARSDLEYFEGGLHGVVFSDGSAIIADRKAQKVVAVDSTGVPALFARRGSGPGEIEYPSAVYADIGGRVGILDGALGRLTRFEVAGNRSTRVDDFRTSIQTAYSCAIDGRYVGLQYRPPDHGVFSVYSLNGELLSQFGPPFVAGSDLRRFVHTKGRVICHADPPTVLVATDGGELLSFGLDGRFNWRKKIPDAEPGEEFGTGGAIGFRIIPNGASRSRWVLSLTAVSRTLGAVQLQEYLPAPDGSDEAFRRGRVLTKVFELVSGRLVGEQDDIPEILHASERLLLLLHWRDAQWVRTVRFRLAPASQSAD